MIGISYTDHKMNEYVWQQVNILARHRELLSLSIASYHGLAMSAGTMRCQKIILQGTVDGSHRRARPHKSWRDNIKVWTGQSLSSLLHITGDRNHRVTIAVEASVGVPRNDAWASWMLVSS